MNCRYPVYAPFLGEKEKEYLENCITTSWISSGGEYIERFEAAVARYVNVRHAIAVMNGTAALHLCMLAAGVESGAEVIVPAFTYVASGNAAIYVGATPVIMDVDPAMWNLTAEGVRSAISSATRCVIMTDIYGLPCDLRPLRTMLKDRDVILIEDAAESLGASLGDACAGALGDMSVLSFFGNKIITTGEGGMVLTNEDGLAQRVRVLMNQGNSPNRRYFHDVLGYNYRMTNMQAAIGFAQMERIEEIIDRKKAIAYRYRERLDNRVQFQRIPADAVSNHWLVSVLLPRPSAPCAAHLEQRGIETRPFFTPLSELPFYSNADMPVSGHLAAHGLSLPSYPALDVSDIDCICDSVIEFLNEEKA